MITGTFLFCMLALGEVSTNTEKVSDQEFVKACQQGFKASFSKAEKAAELGWGTAEVKTDPQTWTKMAWYAWVDDEGIIQIAFNGLADQNVLTKIWAHDGITPLSDSWKATDWTAWRIYYIGDDKHHQMWLHQDEACFTWLRLGQANAKADQALQDKLGALKKLGVINNAAISK